MGSTHSTNRNGFFPLFSSARYQRLHPDSSALLSQPLLQHQNLFTEIAHEVEAHREKSSALEKEILGLKSSFSRLETMVQSKLQSRPISDAKGIEVGKQEAIIISLKEKVDNMKKSLDGELIGRVADKRIYSSGFSNQGLALKRLQEKNIEVEKEIAELKTRVHEMTSTMVDMASVIAELKLESIQPKEANESARVTITEMGMMTVSKEELCIVLIFLIAVVIGLNL